MNKKIIYWTSGGLLVLFLIFLASNYLLDDLKGIDDCCCGNTENIYYFDLINLKLIGYHNSVVDQCGEQNSFYYSDKGVYFSEFSGEDFDGEINKYIEEFDKFDEDRFHRKIEDYNKTCEGCLLKIYGFVGE